MRKRIYEIIEVSKEDDKASHVYDIFMIIVIVLSLLPLTMKDPAPIWGVVDSICVTIFIIDYILRLITADYKYGSKSIMVVYTDDETHGVYINNGMMTVGCKVEQDQTGQYILAGDEDDEKLYFVNEAGEIKEFQFDE